MESLSRRDERFERRASYTNPFETTIRSIPTIIVDPHNEVLLAWIKLKENHATLVHIDHHSDLAECVVTFQRAKERWSEIKTYPDYVKKCIQIGEFISVAVHEGVVRRIYWFDPQDDHVIVYRRKKHGKITNEIDTYVDEDGCITWNINFSDTDSCDPLNASSDIFKNKGPLILDIDLDAFLHVADPSGQDSHLVHERIRKTQRFFESIGKKPSLISIARSQTPTTFVPPDKVDEIQKQTLRMLDEVFERL